MSVSADTLTRTVFCKVPGCTGEALARMGAYAGLCGIHKVAQRDRIVRVQRAAQKERWAKARAERPAGEPLAASAPPVSLRDVSVREIETPLGPPASRLDIQVAVLRGRRRQADDARKTARELTVRALEAKAHADALEAGYRDALQKIGL